MSEDAAHLEIHYAAHTETDIISVCVLIDYLASVQFDTSASPPRNSLTGPPSQNNNNPPPWPLMRPPTSCLYYVGRIPIERQQRGDRQSLRDLWSPPRPKPSNAPLTESHIMDSINIELSFPHVSCKVIYG